MNEKKKNRSNRKKHSVWFEEAQHVFDDVAALRFNDTHDSDGEDRFILLGMSGSSRTLVVVFCERENQNTIRIISARKATKKEIKIYEEGI